VPDSLGRSLRARLRAPPVMGGLLPVRRSEVAADVLAGITMAAVSIPVALGYAKIAGMPVVTGLYTLLLPMAVFAILGSSRHLVVGADSATAAILGAAKQALLAQLTRENNPWKARDLAEALARLNPGSGERAQVGQALLTLLARQDDPWKVQSLAKALVRLNLGPEDSEQVAEALRALITRETDAQIFIMLAETLAALGLEERNLARQALLRQLVRGTNAKHAATLVGVLSRLEPDVQALETWQSWAIPADRNLLAATRRNSTLSSWLEVLPKLRDLPA